MCGVVGGGGGGGGSLLTSQTGKILETLDFG